MPVFLTLNTLTHTSYIHLCLDTFAQYCIYMIHLLLHAESHCTSLIIIEVDNIFMYF